MAVRKGIEMKIAFGLAVICTIGLAGCQSSTADKTPEQPTPLVPAQYTLEQVRIDAGVPPLKRNAALTRAAQAHAEDMAKRGYYAHTTPEGVTFDKRISDAGYCVASMSENLTEKAQTEERAIEMWMNSPSHRKNMLNGKFTHYGMGQAGGYWVLDLGGKCVR